MSRTAAHSEVPGSAVDLVVRHELRDGVDVVSLVGHLDGGSAATLRERLRDVVGEARHDVVIDLTGVVSLESMGMGVLVGALRQAHLHGGTVELAGLSARDAKTLRAAGLAGAFDVHPPVAAA